MTSFPRRTEKSKIELSPSQKGKNTLSRFSGFKVFLFIFVSAFFWSETSFAVVHSVENISEKVKGDRLSLSDVNSILGTIRGFFFDDSTGFVGVGTDSPASKLEVRDDGNNPSISISNSVNGLVKWSLTHDNNYDLSIGHNAAAGGQELILGTKTNGAESMRIDASGNVGIGTTSPGAKLEVNTDIDITANPDSKGLRLKESHGDWLLSLGVENVTNEGFAIRDVSQGTYPFVIREETGNVGIGTTSPDKALHVSGSNGYSQMIVESTAPAGSGGDAGIQLQGSGATNRPVLVGKSDGTFQINKWINNSDWGATLMTILTNGNVGIGTTDPDEMLEVSGSVKSNGTILTSDSRFKQNIKPISAALEKVSALRGVHFDWKKNQFPEKNFADGTQLGLIAQEVESVFPEVVSTDANGLKSVNYPALIAPLVQSIHTLKLQNEALQSELQEIKDELAGQ